MIVHRCAGSSAHRGRQTPLTTLHVGSYVLTILSSHWVLIVFHLLYLQFGLQHPTAV